HVKAIVNAAGPWVKHVAEDILDLESKTNLRLVKGSHIVVRKFLNHDHAFILQGKDGRVIFVIPYMNDFTLIGTTDVLLDALEQPVTISNEEIQYLCNNVNEYLQHNITPQDVLWEYAGIRALHSTELIEARNMTRDYLIEIDEGNGNAPALSIFGGKLTTYRSLAETIVNHLQKYFPNLGKPWTTRAYLPGGFLPNDDLAAYTQHILKTYAPLPPDILRHYINNYGTRAVEVLMNSHILPDLGNHFGGALYKREVDYLVQHEWAKTAEDILWRRGKQGLLFTPEQTKNLENYLSSLAVPHENVRG
ncbi:MAG TPA: glycerol-3-phosphate dehydrogenase, partial [Gammaproteobacteria bacterium]|nr:glycerol-3-phosphate dehydrogenase [Gammaproteobacteria bacterium]